MPYTQLTEREQAAHCGLEAAAAVRAALANPDPGTIMDHDLLHAERMTRLAVHHAFKAQPSLRPPDAYDEARAQQRRRR